MPRIKTLRVINAHFNDNNGIYENFTMELEGHSFVYELTNGGGKTVLILLLMQCVIPNSHFDHKKPLKYMFMGVDGNWTTHVMIEWELDEGVHEHKYLLTGFCAKKKLGHGDGENEEIKYFNYINLYNESNEYDICNIPLCDVTDSNELKSVTDYSDTFSMLKNLEKSPDSRYRVQVFEKKGEYQERIKKFNLLESEFNLMLDINVRENYLQDYFRRFVSSKKLIQDLLVYTIDNCLRDKHHIMGHDGEMLNSEDIAMSVYRFRDNIKKLQKIQKHFRDYEQLDLEVKRVSSDNDKVIKAYQIHDDAVKITASQYRSYKNGIQEIESDIESSVSRLKELQESIRINKLKIEEIRLKQMEVQVNTGRISLNLLEKKKNDASDLHNNLRKKLNYAYATDKYVLITEYEKRIKADMETVASIKKANSDVYFERDQVGKILSSRYSEEFREAKSLLDSENSKKIQIKQEIDSIKDNRGGKKERLKQHENKLAELIKELSDLKTEYSNLTEQHQTYRRITSNFFGTCEELTATRENIEELNAENLTLHDENVHLGAQRPGNVKESEEIKHKISDVENKIDSISEDIENYLSDNRNVMEIISIYDADDIDSCIAKVVDYELSTFKEKVRLDDESEVLKRRLKALDEYGYDILNEELLNVCSILNKKYNFAICGMDHLKRIPDEMREDVLTKAPWIAKSVLLAGDGFRSITENPSRLPTFVSDSSVIIANIEHLNPDKKEISLGDVFIPSREPKNYIDSLDETKAKNNLDKEILKNKSATEKCNTRLETIKIHKESLESFVKGYIENHEDDYESEMKTSLSNQNILKSGLEKNLSDVLKCIKSSDDKIEQNKSSIIQNKNKLDELNQKAGILERLSLLEANQDIKEKDIKFYESEIDKLKKELVSIEDKHTRLDIDFSEKADAVKQLEGQVANIDKKIRYLKQYENTEVAIINSPLRNLKTVDLCAKFKGLDARIKNTDVNVEEKEKAIRSNQDAVILYKKEIVDQHGISWGHIVNKNPQHSYSEESKKHLQEQISDSEADHNRLVDEFNNDTGQQIASEKLFTEKITAYNSIAFDKYVCNSNLIDSSGMDNDLSNLKKECTNFLVSVESLEKVNKEQMDVLQNYKKEYELYEQLDYEYQLSQIDVSPSEMLKSFKEISKLLGESKKEIGEKSEEYSSSVREFIEAVSELEVDADYTTNISSKFPLAHSLIESYTTKKNIDDYLERLSTDIAIIKEEMEGLKKDEQILVDRVVRFTKIYKEHLKDFPELSKIRLNENTYKNSVKIDFEKYEHRDDQAANNIRRYIQDLLNDDNVDEKKIVARMTPKELITKVIDMDAIKVQVRKIDKMGAHKFQDWERVVASGGQENAIYLVFVAALLSYIREIVVNRSDKNTSKILIIDNPFAATGAPYLWEKIWSILERNNIQLICPTHNIDARTRAFFPVTYILTEDISANGRTRVVVKESSMNGASVKRVIDLRNKQKTLDSVFN